MNKTLRTIIIVALFIAIIGILAFAINSPYIKTRIYIGDRITGFFAMSVDGKPYEPVDKTLEYENTGTQRLSTDIDGFKIKGGKYGMYNIGFILENKELYKLTNDDVFLTYPDKTNLCFRYLNTNWWHITNMNLTADLTKENGEWKLNVKAVYTESPEDGLHKAKIVEKTFDYSDVAEKGNADIQFGI